MEETNDVVVTGDDDDFNAGFVGGELLTETPAEEAPAEVPVEEPPAPKLAVITEEEYQRLVARAAEIDLIKERSEKALSTAFGKIGGIERQLHSKPANVTLTAQGLKRLHSDFPELSEALAADLSEALQSQFQVTGAAQIDPGQLDQLVQAKLGAAMQDVQDRVEKATEVKLLTRQHRDWREVTSTPEFSAWVANQSREFRQQLNDTWDSVFIADALDQFKESKKPKAVATPARQKRFEAAVQPKGVGGNSSRSTDDDFNAGFYGTS